jgi:OOP family OmpA-OmpF porin
MFKLSAIAVALLFPAVAAAQPAQGLYVSGSVGANFAGDLTSSHQITKVDTDTGPLGLAALGWRLGDGFRAEIEGSYRSNGISDIFTRRVNGRSEALDNFSGNVGTYAAMANLAYDLPVQAPWGLKPYIGAGVGYGWTGFNGQNGGGETIIFHLPQNNTYTGPGVARWGTAGALAYQAMIGASLPVRGVRGLELTAEYRFFGTAQAAVPVTRTATGGNLVNGAVPSESTHNGLHVQDDSLLVGVRYNFGP